MEFASSELGRRAGTIAEHLAKILAHDVAGYPPSYPNPNGYPNRGWCDTIKRSIQEIDNLDFSPKQLSREITNNALGDTWTELRRGILEVIDKGLCDDSWGGFGGGSFAR